MRTRTGATALGVGRTHRERVAPGAIGSVLHASRAHRPRKSSGARRIRGMPDWREAPHKSGHRLRLLHRKAGAAVPHREHLKSKAHPPWGCRQPNQINSHCATIRPLDIYRLDFRKIGPWNRTRQPHGLLNFVAFPTLPDDQIGNHSRVVQNRANSTGPERGNLLAVYAVAVEAPAIPPNLPFSLFHHLIPIPLPSSKIPVRWCVFKESVKVCTPESPSSADDAPLDFSSTDVFAHRARTQTQHFRRIVERQQTVSDRFGSIFSGGTVPRSRFVFAVFHFDSFDLFQS